MGAVQDFDYDAEVHLITVRWYRVGENDTGFGRKRKWICRWLERLYRCHNRRKKSPIRD